MASLLSCRCACGYDGEAWVAASRSGHGKHFRWPFSCRGCEQVVSVDVYADPAHCPECQSPKITRYGLFIPDPPTGKIARILDAVTATRRGYKKQLASLYNSRVEMAYAGRDNVTYGLPRQKYECPGCGDFTLTFELEALVD